MPTSMDSISAVERPQHRRNKSASVLKSMMPSARTLKRTQTDDGSQLGQNTATYNPFLASDAPFLPPNHPHAGQRILGEIHPTNNTPPSPRRSNDAKDERPKMLHKKTLSTISLRSLGNEKEEKPKEKSKPRPKSFRSTSRDQEVIETPKKSKTSTGLASVFSKGKSAKKEQQCTTSKDQENTTPPSSAAPAVHTPIWAEFSSDAARESRSTVKVPLNDKRSIMDEMERYMPKNHQQRNFYGMEQPLTRPERPKSGGIASSGSSISVYETLTKKISHDRPGIGRTSSEQKYRKQDDAKAKTAQPEATSDRTKKTGAGGRVRAAVTIFNNRAKEMESTTQLDAKQIDAEFEAVLEARNIPAYQRQAMRGLRTTMKADFIRTHKIEPPSSGDNSASSKAGVKGASSGLVLSSEETLEVEANVPIETPQSPNTKRGRPRSKTFTFSRGDKGSASPSKKHKSDTPVEVKRSSKLGNLPNTSSTSLVKSNSSSFLGKLQKAPTPDEYVSYLRKGTDPKEVEVGKLHKLRQLLRNETVSWVVNFIELGGMNELAGLLHRIIEVEWREDHEDQLLHETLLCLKALCTTDLALQKLCDLEKTLFPALLGMIFDPEHKGPSEFTTREIIMKLLLAHLGAAISTPEILPGRARTILSYLADPAPPEEKAPIEFILSMRQSRPYKVWCTEVVNVTKEVFWIFLHHLNIISYPQTPPIAPESTAGPNSKSKAPPPARSLDADTYAKEFFPRQRPPVPAAPYVGGVEWDATNYIASHLDLLNALISCLPTCNERNAFRSELRNSGFERSMGGMLRTCKEKFYGSVHDGLRTWVAAACADGWDVKDVRMGPKVEEVKSPRKSPTKKVDKAPVLDKMPKLDLGLGIAIGEVKSGKVGEAVVDSWL